MRFVLAIFLAFAPVAALAFPKLYHVTDVASDDTLNIRAEPKSGTDILGELAHDATHVQVMALDASGKWGQVYAGESGMGWVFMRYMVEEPGAVYPDWPFLACFGSESPWRFEITQGETARYKAGYEFTGPSLTVSPLRSGGEHLFSKGILAEGPGVTVTAAIEQAQCESTMVDAQYGLRASIWALTPDGPVFHNGCCSLMAPFAP